MRQSFKRYFSIFQGKVLLTLFFPMSSFDPPENIRKPKVFLCFQGDQKGTSGRKGLKILFMTCSFIIL